MTTSTMIMNAARSQWRTFKVGLLIVLFWLTLLISPGAVEGQYWPVVEPITIDRIIPDADERHSIIWGHGRKLRDCALEKIDWRMGIRVRNQSMPIPLVLGRPKIRPVGEYTFGPWQLDLIPPDDILHNSFANVYHRCDVFGFALPWLTRSKFYN